MRRPTTVRRWAVGWALCGHEAPAGFQAGVEEEEEAAARSGGSDLEGGRQLAGGQESIAAAALEARAAAVPAPGQGEGGWRPHQGLPREARIAVGQQCKRLIDAGRLEWLAQRGFAAEAVRYVEAQVSGENRLLLATAAGRTPA